jgi:hypothetical protein
MAEPWKLAQNDPMFVIAIMGAVIGFAYWLHKTDGLGEHTI